MNAIMVAFFVAAGSTGPQSPPSEDQELAAGAKSVPAILATDEESVQADYLRPAIRTIEKTKTRFDPKAATWIDA